MSKFKVLKSLKKRGLYGFSGNPKRSYGSAKEKDGLLEACAMGSSRPTL
jgi:hypothetical protein